MSDLISRQAAISLPVKPREDRYFQTQSLDDAYDYGWRDLQRCIEKLPSAQPERPEIIRCKNCIHLGHAYMMPCKNCRRNQMLPDWYEVETERRKDG